MEREQGWRVLGVAGIVALAGVVGYGLFVPEHVPSSAAAPPEPEVTEEPAPVVVFLGDSYTAGARASSDGTQWVNLVSAAEGWEAHNLARGGTGFVNGVDGDTAPVACGLDYCPSFTEMIAEAAALNPDVVVVSGGRNDANQDAAQAAAGVEQFFTALREALPNATIIGTSVLWDDEPPPDTIPAMSEAVRTNLERIGGRYLDLGQPLTADKIDTDGVHPNDAGHQTIADAIQALL